MNNYSTIINSLSLGDVFGSKKSSKPLSASIDFSLKYFSISKDHQFESLTQLSDIIQISRLHFEKNNGSVEDESSISIQLMRDLALRFPSIYILLKND
jgi:hypothetical protein